MAHQKPRRGRDTLFRKNDIFRLIESARRKGLPIARINVTRDGDLSLVVGDEPEKTIKSNNNEVESWIARHEHQS